MSSVQGTVVFDNCPAFSVDEYLATNRVSDTVPACQQVWKKTLADGGVAVAMVNFDTNPATVQCDASCMSKIGFSSVCSCVPVSVHSLPQLRLIVHQRASLGVVAHVDGRGYTRSQL